MCKQIPQARRVHVGFTLVELLVVIAIIGVLVALLLPAVQAARAAARRTQCQNNLKNLGLGLQNYHSAQGEFPVGFLEGPGDQAQWAWPTYLLPYIEQQALYDHLEVNNRRLWDLIRDVDERHILQTALPVFFCPEDEPNELLPGGNGRSGFAKPNVERNFLCEGCPEPQDFELAKSNYMASSGFYDPWGSDAENHDGAFIGHVPISIPQITDGTSNTFALGERDRRCKQGTWCGVRNPPGADMYGTYYVRARVSIKLNDPRDPNEFQSDGCTEGFSSAHAGGAHFVYCDGSVHFISDDISFENGGVRDNRINNKGPTPFNAFDVNKLGVYQKLGIRNDGGSIDESI